MYYGHFVGKLIIKITGKLKLKYFVHGIYNFKAASTHVILFILIILFIYALDTNYTYIVYTVKSHLECI